MGSERPARHRSQPGAWVVHCHHGPSGSGKSTFLHTAAGLDTPTSGSVWIGDTDISRMRPNKLAKFRRKHVGFVFQAYNLLPASTVEQSVHVAALLAGAVDLGIRFFDTAPAYGLSQERLGEFLRTIPAELRADLFVATKRRTSEMRNRISRPTRAGRRSPVRARRGTRRARLWSARVRDRTLRIAACPYTTGAWRSPPERDGAMARNPRFQISRSKSKPAEHLRAAFCEHAITRAFVVNKRRVSQVSAFQ
ncbi:aldo/keto reductase [Agromyces ramosus]|uniref:aldo/keto reductase n=1 Tax=Agromyces ramosus TaxID=33879 RepID=UPI003593BD0B